MKNDANRKTVFEPGLEYAFVPTAGEISFLVVNVERLPKESAPEMLDRLADCVRKYKAEIFMHWIFGGFNAGKKRTEKTAILKWLSENNLQMPIWLRGDGDDDGVKATASQAICMIKKRSNMAYLDRENGSAYNQRISDAYAWYYTWGGYPDFDASVFEKGPLEMTRQIFLDSEGLPGYLNEDTYPQVVRTWIYLPKLLDWYDDFNVVRNTFFKERNLYDLHAIPSSTGIGAANVAGNPMSLNSLMIHPKDPRVTFKAVPSPLQCPALNYKSSFSRAHLIEHPDYRWLLISGTASIAPEGESVYQDDIKAQIKLTMEIVEAILKEQKMSWHDVTRSIVYLKSPEYAQDFYNWMTENAIPPFPAVCFHCNVCRDELLFEIELDAIQSRA